MDIARRLHHTVVHLNDIAAPESIAYLIKYDSVHGTWELEVEYRDDYVTITEGERLVKIAISQQKDASMVCDKINAPTAPPYLSNVCCTV
jgi:glyceraldehyde-3-phosphate dehydrogenase/erythrose-4-phosphate dehydrogenase